MLGDLIDIRSKTLALLSLSLHEWYKQRRVVSGRTSFSSVFVFVLKMRRHVQVTVRWFDPSNEYDLEHGYREDILEHLKCQVRHTAIMNQLQKVGKNSADYIGLGFVLQMAQDQGPLDLSLPDVRRT